MRAAETSPAHAPGSVLALRLIREVAAVVPAALIGGAGLVAAIDSSTLHLGLLQPLPSLLPIDPDISEPATAAIAAIGLLGLSIGLARGKRVAWWLAMATLAAALLALVELVALAPGEVPTSTSDGERRAAAIARRFGQGALLPFQVGPEALRFSPQDRDGLLAYGRDGRLAIVLGDPIGPVAEATSVLD